MARTLDRFELMRLLVRIAETGSLTAAGRSLGLSQPSASRQLRSLEAELGTQLVMRSTHDLAFTDAGQEFLENAKRLLAGWEQAVELAGADTGGLKGSIRVAAPMGLGQAVLADIAADFVDEHPGVSLDWQLVDEPGDLVREGFDLWIRVGPVRDEALIVRKLWTIERIVVAAPEAGITCQNPSELEGQPAVILGPYVGSEIELSGPDDEHHTLSPSARINTDNIFVAQRLTLQSHGYSILPLWLVENDLADGTLLHLCQGWSAPHLTLSMAYPQSRYRPARVTEFIRHFRERLSTTREMNT